MLNLKQRKKGIPKVSTEIVPSEKNPKLIIPTTSYALEINPLSTIKEMIEKGNYGSANPDIKLIKKESGPKPEKVTSVIIKLVHFSEPILDNEVDNKLSENGLESVGIMELLAFGATYPENEDSEHLIVARGSNWYSMIPGLDFCKKSLETETKKERVLNLYWTERKDYYTEWSSDVLFAVKEKVKSSEAI